MFTFNNYYDPSPPSWEVVTNIIYYSWRIPDGFSTEVMHKSSLRYVESSTKIIFFYIPITNFSVDLHAKVLQ